MIRTPSILCPFVIDNGRRIMKPDHIIRMKARAARRAFDAPALLSMQDVQKLNRVVNARKRNGVGRPPCGKGNWDKVSDSFFHTAHHVNGMAHKSRCYQ